MSVIEQVAQQHREIVVASQPPTRQETTKQNIFLGIGLTSNGELSPGLNLNVLPMFALAMAAQKQVPNAVLNVLIADLHSLQSLTDVSDQEIADRSEEVMAIVCRALLQMGVAENSVQVFRASQHPDFNFSDDVNSYQDRQIRDTLIAHQQLQVGIKVGWQSKRQARNGVIRDERFFDDQAVEKHNEALVALGFIRSVEGVSVKQWKGEQLTIPPYFGEPSMNLGQEIVLSDIESNQLKKHLSKIGRSLAEVVSIEMRGKKSLHVLQEFVDGLRE